MNFELRPSDVEWFKKLNEKLWIRNYSGSGSNYSYHPSGMLKIIEWHCILALINIYNLPCSIVYEKNDRVSLNIYGHMPFINVEPNKLLKIVPFHIRDFAPGYDYSKEIKLFFQKIVPVANTKRNKELLNFYGLHSLKEEEQADLRYKYMY